METLKGIRSIARDLAIEEHGKVNQVYGGYLPYQYHLELVQAVAQKYISLIPEKDRDVVLAACWLHDTLEDCHVTYNDVMTTLDKAYGLDIRRDEPKEVAEIVYAVTNEKGRTRKERANDAYYEGIKNTKYATFVKLCDRIANVLYSCMFGSNMFEMYRKEQKEFEGFLRSAKYSIMWSDLNYLFDTKEFGFEPFYIKSNF